MKRLFITSLFLSVLLLAPAKIRSKEADTIKVYVYELREDITPASWRKTQKAMRESRLYQADLILLHLNTYGGFLNAADSIRTAIINSEIPVWVFIDNNAASAGALISIAADKIFMKPGGSIGSATVVNQNGEPLPDKYQSYMRALMRSTAEMHGADTIITGNDTTIVWKRNPRIAEAMVDPDIEIEGVSLSGKVLAFTTQEAIYHGYCDGDAKSIEDVIKNKLDKPAVVIYQKLSPMDKIILFLLNPILQGILIMLIVGGIYFELQTPGIGFPLATAVIATILYFAPLYLEGIATHWEIILFIIGVIFLLIEIFVIPGFGVTGITGIILIVISLALAMVDSMELEYPALVWTLITRAFLIVLSATGMALITSIWLGGKLLTSGKLSVLTLKTEEKAEEGYISVDSKIFSLVGKIGVAVTDLRPSGIVEIENQQYDALSKKGFIDRGTAVVVEQSNVAQLIVKPLKESQG